MNPSLYLITIILCREEHSEFSRRMRQTAHDIYMFYKNVFSDKIDGRDLYVAIWFIGKTSTRALYFHAV